MNKRLTLILGVAVLVVAIALGVWYKSRPKPGVETNTNQVKKDMTKSDVDFKKLPDKFPIDLPLENTAQIVQNYNATSKDGKFQATRSYITAKSVQDNLAIFKDYLQKNGYQITSELNKDNIRGITAAKDNVKIQITIDTNKISGKNTVTLNYIESPKK